MVWFYFRGEGDLFCHLFLKVFNEKCVRTCLCVQRMPREFGSLCGYAEMFANLGKEIAFSCITDGQ